MKTIRAGLIGFGTVGSGVYHVLNQNQHLLKKRKAVEVQLAALCDLDTDRVRRETGMDQVTDRWKDLIEDTSIDVIVELIGGIEPARTIIIEALKNGKHVVTANKKLLAEAGQDIFDTEQQVGCRLAYEAAIGGGVPCVLALRDGLVANNINSVVGILNGTTNYILTLMEDEQIPFEDALRDAQEKGFAEADPTFDIEGLDAGHKIALLARLAYGKRIDYKKIPIEGITGITQEDIHNATEMGYVIKLLGIARAQDEDIDIRVHPALLDKNDYLASVRDEFNAILYDCDMTDPIILYGKGAGRNPTASAVVSDILSIASGYGSEPEARDVTEEANYITGEQRMLRYYIRILTEDRPGILSKISGVLGEHGISISSVIQHEIDDKIVPLIIMTHKARESDMFRARDRIETFEFVHESIVIIRVEDGQE